MPSDSRAYEEIRQHAELMELLSQVSRVALEEDDLEKVLKQVVDFLEDRLPVTIASMAMLDESGQRFETEVYAGKLLTDLTGRQEGWPITDGVSGRCVRLGEPQLVLDVHSDPDYIPGNPDVRCEYITPIRFRGRIVGILNLESTVANAFTPTSCMVFDRVADQVAGAIHLAGLNRRLEAANRELARLSRLDELTGVANRRRFDEALGEEWRRAARARGWVSLAIADIDAFKQFNDALGHLAGDACLEEVATLIAGQVRRAGELAARLGGEEFALILPGVPPDEALRLAERLRREVEARGYVHPASPVARVVTVSVGVSSLAAEPGSEARELVLLADGALYEAKRTGRNRVVSRNGALR
jgi:diguanylate cyclase (GGDEF)-like protein